MRHTRHDIQPNRHDTQIVKQDSAITAPTRTRPDSSLPSLYSKRALESPDLSIHLLLNPSRPPRGH
jgi:hypothetical protein